ncbi:YVTN repeat-like/Quino protein amine dehydrogenase [Epithele typhae]|uniref:YVTN repeat-like/Quino protein amine dehydrogenase n=1 Tax=Epithele typhae TaxID=378194 RepID=UPI0020082D04|nr:YVTN repeat-like/Quino protein amine dehydrogenase [Epithele typhae]KAH9939670.1 YVTN repeat-like/Quino protein amine dehydrogenase [Epithele typhae]
MDFTEIYRQTASLVAFSPGTHFLLTAVQDRLVVRRSDSFQIARTWLVDPTPSPTAAALPRDKEREKDAHGWITHAGWSCDSEYVLGACARAGVVQVFKLRDEAWTARIDAGSEGLVKAEWAPDGRTVLCFSEWGLRVTMWSLVTGAATYVQYPIHPDRGYAFRNDARYFVLAERHKSKDTLGVYDAGEAYRMVRHFPLPTSSLASVSLSPTGNYLAVWEGPLEYKLYIVTLAGSVVGSFCPEPDPGFGIRMVSWHPSGLFLAVAGHDDKVYILESLTWNSMATLDLPTRIPAGVHVWKEPSAWLEATHGRGFLSYERIQSPYILPTSASQTRAKGTRPTPSAQSGSSTTSSRTGSGTTQIGFNTSGTLLLVRSASAPVAVLLYDFPLPRRDDPALSQSQSPPAPLKPRLRSVLLHERPVSAARWNPDPGRAGRLAVACGSQSVYLWSDEWVVEPGADGARDEDEAEAEVAECVGVPAQKFETRDVAWAPDGKGMVLFDRETFCCAFEVEEDGQGDGGGLTP